MRPPKHELDAALERAVVEFRAVWREAVKTERFHGSTSIKVNWFDGRPQYILPRLKPSIKVITS